jgi:hypothetical protein
MDSERTRAGKARKAARSHAQGVPIIGGDMVERQLGDSGEGVHATIPEREITEPWALLERGLDAQDLEHVQRLRRDSDDPYALAYRLSKEIARIKAEDLSAQRTQANQLLELIAHPPHQATTKLQADVASLECDINEIKESVATAVISVEALTRWWKPIRATLIFLAVAALGGVGFFVHEILDGAQSKGETQIRIDHLERALLDLRQDLRDDRAHRYEPPDRPWLPAPAQSGSAVPKP